MSQWNRYDRIAERKLKLLSNYGKDLRRGSQTYVDATWFYVVLYINFNMAKRII